MDLQEKAWRQSADEAAKKRDFQDDAWIQNALEAEKKGYIGADETWPLLRRVQQDLILDILLTAWRKNPELRLGQLMHIAAVKSGCNMDKSDIFSVSDEVIEEGLSEFLKGNDKTMNEEHCMAKHGYSKHEQNMTCFHCGKPLSENRRVNELYTVNNTAAWAKEQLRIIADMLNDRNLSEITKRWFVDEIRNIKDGIRILSS